MAISSLCIASLTSRCGEWHFYDYGALQGALAALAETPPDHCQAPTREPPALLDGFSIERWAAYAKLKARIASSVCKDNARLKRLASTESLGEVKGDCRHAVDHVFEADPWLAASTALGCDCVSTRSACDGVSEDVWSKWMGACSDTRLDDGDSYLPGNGGVHSLHEESPETPAKSDTQQVVRGVDAFGEEALDVTDRYAVSWGHFALCAYGSLEEDELDRPLLQKWRFSLCANIIFTDV